MDSKGGGKERREIERKAEGGIRRKGKGELEEGRREETQSETHRRKGN